MGIMLDGTITSLDDNLTQAISAWPDWLYWLMWLASTIGHPVTLSIIGGAIGVYALYTKRYRLTISMAAAGVAILINTLLKYVIQRPRPDTLYTSNMYFQTASFPSGHAFSAMVVVGLLAYLAHKRLPKPWHIVAPVLLGLFILLVGMSRIYLGAHFVTDVIAGWALGAVFLALIAFFCKPKV
jgi:undecaprenyl-diphosphatase